MFTALCPRPPGRLSGLRVFLYKSVFYGVFVWARRALNGRKRRFLARAVGMVRDADYDNERGYRVAAERKAQAMQDITEVL
jgi:hypothetical protein